MSNYFQDDDETIRRLAENDPQVMYVEVKPYNCARFTAALQGNTRIQLLAVFIGAEVDRRNELPADDVQAQWNDFCRAAQALPSLNSVYVSMTREECSDEDWILLGQLLEHTKQIKTLWLCGCHEDGITLHSTAVRQLAGSLTELAGLEYVDFDYFQIQPTDLAPLLSALSSLPKLKRLELKRTSHNAPLHDDAFVVLERLLRKRSLVKFRYENVCFSDAQADAISDIMSRMFDTLDVYFQQFKQTNSETMTNLNKKINTIARLNKAGRRYLAEHGPECKAAGINVLSTVSDDLDCLYYHLRENPALMSDIVEKSPNKKRKR